MRLQTIAIIILTLTGFALRLHYLTTTHPFFDEYTTVLAARQILRQGWPVLPSGLFYEHGLLATYLTAPFTALFIDIPLAEWQPAHWGLMLARWPSLLTSTVTIPLIFAIGRHTMGQVASGKWQVASGKWQVADSRSATHRARVRDPQGKGPRPTGPGSAIALLAAGLFALSPEGMVWGGRARMYALATLLVLLTVYWAYRGAIRPAPAKYRWLVLLTLLAILLTQFGAMTLVLPLVVSMLGVGWLSYRRATGDMQHATRVWFLRKTIFLEGLALVAVIGFVILIKRLGRPLGATTLGAPNSSNFLTELLNTISYQTTFHFTWTDTTQFLARQFGIPHHFWLTFATILGAITGLIYWWVTNQKGSSEATRQSGLSAMRHTYPADPPFAPSFYLFLWLIFGLIILEMVTLLEPFRRNPRYIVMYLPLFYLIAAHSIFNFRLIPHLISRITDQGSRITLLISSLMTLSQTQIILALALLILFTVIGVNDLRIALITPEPAYEEAFARIRADWQPGDTLLTMNTPAAGLYLGHADGFTIQNDADQFLLDADAAPVDRWLGVSWLGTMADFNAALNTSQRTWFVIDTIRQPVYFRGDWLAVVNSQMEQVWAKDNALVYRTRPDRTPLPTQPDTLIEVTLGNSIQLVGYTLDKANPCQCGPDETSPSELALALFWQPLTPPSANYTTFLHLRNGDGATIAQHDGQPLDGAYPTSRWQPNETIIDPITLSLPKDLPAGSYTLFTGLYQFDTLERLSVANDTSGENAILLGKVILP